LCPEPEDGQKKNNWEMKKNKYIAHPLSVDHRPDNPAEEARIRGAGGYVTKTVFRVF
jgi:hypothetical protein